VKQRWIQATRLGQVLPLPTEGLVIESISSRAVAKVPAMKFVRGIWTVLLTPSTPTDIAAFDWKSAL